MIKSLSHILIVKYDEKKEYYCDPFEKVPLQRKATR